MTAEQLHAIKQQLVQFCDCVEDITDKDVADMIFVISLATGWAKDPCDTLLISPRREVIELPPCMDCPFTYAPYYTPFDVDSMAVSVVRTKGMEETVTPVEFVYSDIDKVLRIDTGLPSCKCACNECGCPTEYKLILEYNAGYDLLPECLLPVFCNLIEVIHAKNACDCCTDCGCESDKATYDRYGNLVTQQIDYKSGDVVSVFLETDLGKMLVAQYKNQLGMLSLLRRRHNYWGYVV